MHNIELCVYTNICLKRISLQKIKRLDRVKKNGQKRRNNETGKWQSKQFGFEPLFKRVFSCPTRNFLSVSHSHLYIVANYALMITLDFEALNTPLFLFSASVWVGARAIPRKMLVMLGLDSKL